MKKYLLLVSVLFLACADKESGFIGDAIIDANGMIDTALEFSINPENQAVVKINEIAFFKDSTDRLIIGKLMADLQSGNDSIRGAKMDKTTFYLDKGLTPVSDFKNVVMQAPDTGEMVDFDEIVFRKYRMDGLDFLAYYAGKGTLVSDGSPYSYDFKAAMGAVFFLKWECTRDNCTTLCDIKVIDYWWDDCYCPNDWQFCLWLLK